MHLFLGLALFSLSLVSSAPVQDMWKDMQDPEFQEAVENAHSLISKILTDIPTAHKSWIHAETLSLDKGDSSLQYLKKVLNLPAAPALKPLSKSFTLDVCLSQIAQGLKLHQTLLKVVVKLTHAKLERVDGLLYDIRDLLMQIHKMQTLMKAVSVVDSPEVSEVQLEANLSPHLTDEYVSQVAAHLSLLQLRDFTRTVKQSLQNIISSAEDQDTQTRLGGI